MANLIYDKALSFGTLSPVAAGDFPNDLNLGAVAGSTDHYPGKDFTGTGRLTVDVCGAVIAAGGSITVTVKGSMTAAALSGGRTVGVNTFTAEDTGPLQTAISPNDFKFLRVSIAVSGAVSGDAEAFLNTYGGK